MDFPSNWFLMRSKYLFRRLRISSLDYIRADWFDERLETCPCQVCRYLWSSDPEIFVIKSQSFQVCNEWDCSTEALLANYEGNVKDVKGPPDSCYNWGESSRVPTTELVEINPMKTLQNFLLSFLSQVYYW